MQFSCIPSQSKLEQIAIWNSRGFDIVSKVSDPEIILPRLQQFYLIGTELDDEVTARRLNIFTESPTESLRELKIDHNNLIRVPGLVESFSNLVECLWRQMKPSIENLY